MILLSQSAGLLEEQRCLDLERQERISVIRVASKELLDSVRGPRRQLRYLKSSSQSPTSQDEILPQTPAYFIISIGQGASMRDPSISREKFDADPSAAVQQLFNMNTVHIPLILSPSATKSLLVGLNLWSPELSTRAAAALV